MVDEHAGVLRNALFSSAYGNIRRKSRKARERKSATRPKEIIKAPMKTAVVNVRTREDVKAFLKATATQNDTTISAIVTAAVEAYAAAQGAKIGGK